MKSSGVNLVCAGLIAVSGLAGCNETAFTVAPNLGQSADAPALPPPNSDLCVINPQAEACNRAPVVSTPGIVTILFTLSQIPQEAATLIIANAIKYASPAANPKILFLKDSATHGEDEGDVDYIKTTLLAGYKVDYAVIATGGLTPAEIGDHDLVIVSNPGHPLSDAQTLSTLDGFAGGVILIGDDLAQGAGFSMSGFIGAVFKSNGTSVTCGGRTYEYDNLKGYSYQVTMNETFLPGIPDADKHYTYGNDIDEVVVDPGVQVLATSHAAPGTCVIDPRPTVFRRPR